MTETEMLSDEQLKEIEARAESATPRYVVDWSKGEHALLQAGGWRPSHEEQPRTIATFDPNDGYLDLLFCAEARTDIPALCQTARALRKELSEAYYESCEICDQEIVSGDGTKIHTFAVGGCCWNKSQETIAALRDQLAQTQAENERLASQLKEWQEDKDTKAGYL